MKKQVPDEGIFYGGITGMDGLKGNLAEKIFQDAFMDIFDNQAFGIRVER